jgi:hypothetical protein
MDHTKWGKLKFWVIIYLVLIFGSFLGYYQEKLNNKEIVKEVPKVIYVDKDRETWIKLVDIDDKLLLQSALGISIASNVIDNISVFNYSNIDRQVVQIQSITRIVTELSADRHSLLRKLGIE